MRARSGASILMEHGMIDKKFNSRVLEDFVRGPDVWAGWDAARCLMAAKQMQSAASSQSFQASFQELGKAAVTDRGTNQLLAIALIVRISELVKGELRKIAGDILAESLRKSIDGIWTISEAKNLPLESKPSEIRENIALALSYASGPWLEPYLIEALAREEKSSRCRLELTRQLSMRDPHVSHWFNKLSSFSWIDVWNVETADRIGRLRELTIAIAMILREQRNTVVVDEESGPACEDDAGNCAIQLSYSPSRKIGGYSLSHNCGANTGTSTADFRGRLSIVCCSLDADRRIETGQVPVAGNGRTCTRPLLSGFWWRRGNGRDRGRDTVHSLFQGIRNGGKARDRHISRDRFATESGRCARLWLGRLGCLGRPMGTRLYRYARRAYLGLGNTADRASWCGGRALVAVARTGRLVRPVPDLQWISSSVLSARITRDLR